jgi:hypothetical protein
MVEKLYQDLKKPVLAGCPLLFTFIEDVETGEIINKWFFGKLYMLPFTIFNIPIVFDKNYPKFPTRPIVKKQLEKESINRTTREHIIKGFDDFYLELNSDDSLNEFKQAIKINPEFDKLYWLIFAMYCFKELSFDDILLDFKRDIKEEFAREHFSSFFFTLRYWLRFFVTLTKERNKFLPFPAIFLSEKGEEYIKIYHIKWTNVLYGWAEGMRYWKNGDFGLASSHFGICLKRLHKRSHRESAIELKLGLKNVIQFYKEQSFIDSLIKELFNATDIAHSLKGRIEHTAWITAKSLLKFRESINPVLVAQLLVPKFICVKTLLHIFEHKQSENDINELEEITKYFGELGFEKIKKSFKAITNFVKVMQGRKYEELERSEEFQFLQLLREGEAIDGMLSRYILTEAHLSKETIDNLVEGLENKIIPEIKKIGRAFKKEAVKEPKPKEEKLELGLDELGKPFMKINEKSISLTERFFVDLVYLAVCKLKRADGWSNYRNELKWTERHIKDYPTGLREILEKGNYNNKKIKREDLIETPEKQGRIRLGVFRSDPGCIIIRETLCNFESGHRWKVKKVIDDILWELECRKAGGRKIDFEMTDEVIKKLEFDLEKIEKEELRPMVRHMFVIANAVKQMGWKFHDDNRKKEWQKFLREVKMIFKLLKYDEQSISELYLNLRF